MKVVILCGGRGTRLREETQFRPKPMVPIGNDPILWHIMKSYASQGHNDFILCLGYMGEMIKEYFRNYLWNSSDVTICLGREPNVIYHDRHEEENWKVTLADTGMDSLTARRMKLIQKYVPKGESFLFTYGDGVSNIDINAAIECHRKSGKILTLSAVHPSGRFGSLHLEEDGSIKHFMEKPQIEKDFVNGGFMICDYKLFDYLPQDENLMFEQEPIRKLVHDQQINSYQHNGFWQCMDTYQEMQYLNQLWSNNKAPWKTW
jgi:glucose-1-phosphate cytidylyltransferase